MDPRNESGPVSSTSHPSLLCNAPNTRLVAVENSPEATIAEPPPDGGYGWVVVGACFTINCFSWGVTAVSLVAPVSLVYEANTVL